MSFIGSVGKFLNNNAFGSIGNVLTIATSIYSIASEIYAHANGDGTFNDVEDPVLAGIVGLQDEVEGLREDIGELEVALTSLILSEFSGLQQQLLSSAQSRAESALDLLASYQIDADIDRGEIIADVSRAFRDTLAQARQMLEPSDPPTALDAIKAAVGAVGYTLYARLEVARELEGGELASDKIAGQIDDAMTFLEDVVTYIEGRLTVEYVEPFSSVFEVYLDGAAFPDFYSAGWENTAESNELLYRGSPFRFSPDSVTGTYPEPPEVYEGPYGTGVNTYYIPSIDAVVDLSRSQYFDDDGNEVPFGTDGARSGNEIWFAENRAWALERALQWFNIDRDALTETIAGFRELTDGEQMILPSVPGFDNAGTLVGTEGDDLIIGNDGDDLLMGMGDPDIVRGKEGNDTIHGGAGGDRLEGNEGDDVLYGGADDDALIGGHGDDTMDGGAGRDLAIYAGRRSEYDVSWFREGGELRMQVDGPEGSDLLIDVERIVFDNRMVQIQTAASFAPLLGDILFSTGVTRIAEDLMFGSASGGTMDGGLGEDTLIAGGGVTRLIGGTGNDLIVGTPGRAFGRFDTAVFSGARADHVFDVTLDQVLVSGPDGQDTVTGVEYFEFDDATIELSRSGFVTFAGIWAASGGGEEDFVIGGDRDEFMTGGGNDDTMLGGAGDDTIEGDGFLSVSDGNDQIDGGAGNDLLRGNAGNDRLNGGSGADTMAGNDGDDLMRGDHGNDRMFGGQGADTMAGNDGDDLMRGGLDDDVMFGGSGHDNMDGNSGDDDLDGGSGNDTVRGGSGEDDLRGGSDDDVMAGNGGNDILRGGSGNDGMFGGAGSDTLAGNDGDDLLNGGTEDDVLIGGLGSDTLTGGDGADVFVFSNAAHSPHGADRDTIADFTPGEDMIDLSGFGGLSFTGASYTGAGNEVRYDDSIGRLYVDLDGDMASGFSVDLTGVPSLDGGDLIL